MNFAVGAKIGSYKIIKQIGEGGFGKTFLSHHVNFGDKVKACIKVNLDPQDQGLMREEANLLFEVHHMSLPTCREYNEFSGGFSALAMSFIDGKNLADIVEGRRKSGLSLEAEHVCWMMERNLGALGYLHMMGIVHADVKPQNDIIRPQDHNAILVDMGFSKKNPGRHTTPVGYTNFFTPPEIVLGNKPPIPETDIYSLGVTALYAFGGDFRSLTFPGNIPQELTRFFGKFILREPLKRPNDAYALMDELSDIRLKVFGQRHSFKELVI